MPNRNRKAIIRKYNEIQKNPERNGSQKSNIQSNKTSALWSKEEFANLIELIRKYGTNIEEIA